MPARLTAILVALGALVALFAASTSAAVASPAATPDTAYKCGSQCNGRSPSWVIPSNGVQCKNSRVQVASGHPAYNQQAPIDYSVTVHVYYSTVCQTLWATISRIAQSPDTYCTYVVERTVQPYWDHGGQCPAKGSSLTTPMFDDANSGKIAGDVQVISQWYASDGSFHGGEFLKSY